MTEMLALFLYCTFEMQRVFALRTSHSDQLYFTCGSYMGGSAYCISTPLDSDLGVHFTLLLISHVTSGTLPKSCKASVSSNVKKEGP